MQHLRPRGELRDCIAADPRLLAEHRPRDSRVHALVDDADRQASVEQLKGELEGLRTAMLSRAIIEQAKGMLMLRHRCDETAAFLILIRASQQLQLKLRDVAEHVVEWGSGAP